MLLFRERCFFWWVGVACVIAVSALLFFLVVTKTSIDGPIRGDARDYVGYAYNLNVNGVYSRSWAEGNNKSVVPDALRTPGYPFFLRFFFSPDNQKLFINNVLFVQAGIGVMTVFVYLMLFRRFMHISFALLAGLVTAISPHLINASVYLLTESLFTFFLGLHLLLLDKALRSKYLFLAILAGVTLAISFLVRPTTQYLIIAYLMVVMFWLRPKLWENWRILFCLILPVVLITSAWSVRNVIETGRTSDPSLTANFLQHGMYINMMFEDHPGTYGYPYRYDPMNQEIQGNTGKVLENIRQRFKEEPRRYLAWYLIGKPIQFFDWNLTESIGDAFIFAPIYSPYFDKKLFSFTHDIAKALHPFLMFLGFLGALTAIKQSHKNTTAVLFSIVMLYFVGLHIIGAPFPRYSIPLRPVSYGLAFFTLDKIYEYGKTQFRRFNP